MLLVGLMIVVFLAPVSAQAWGWKKCTDPNDVMNFLNAKAPYKQKITRAEITAVQKGSYTEFIVFYKSSGTATSVGKFGWKRSPNPGDVKNFLSGAGAYNRPVAKAKVVAVQKGNSTEYFIFYTKH
jgi:hypothetical protein